MKVNVCRQTGNEREVQPGWWRVESCSGRTAGLNFSFPALFLCYFLLALKESKERLKTNKERKDWIWRSKRTDPDLSGELSEAN